MKASEIISLVKPHVQSIFFNSFKDGAKDGEFPCFKELRVVQVESKTIVYLVLNYNPHLCSVCINEEYNEKTITIRDTSDLSLLKECNERLISINKETTIWLRPPMKVSFSRLENE